MGSMRRLLLKALRSRGATGRHSLCGQLDFTVERPQHWHQWSRSQSDSPLSEELLADVGATGNRRCRAAGGVGPEQSCQRGDQHQPCGQGEVSLLMSGKIDDPLDASSELWSEDPEGLGSKFGELA